MSKRYLWSVIFASTMACAPAAVDDGSEPEESDNLDAQAQAPRRPFPQRTIYAGGSILPNHTSRNQMEDEVRAFHQAWKGRYLKTVPHLKPTQKYVHYNLEGHSSPKNAVSVSEGHGYGMMITAWMAGADPQARADFDALYRFYKAHPSRVDGALMAWQQIQKGSSVVNSPDADSATDGDLDIAYALLLADAQWGSGGAIAYRTAANNTLAAIVRRDVHGRDSILKLGDWAQDGDAKYGGATRSSDLILSHLKAFARLDTSRAPQWQRVYDVSSSIIDAQRRTAQSQLTGFLPDFFRHKDGRYVPVDPGFLEGSHDGDYHYNACRVPFRLGSAVLLSDSSSARALLTLENRFIRSSTDGDPRKIRAGYFVAGGPPGKSYANYADLAFTAPLLVSAAIHSENQSWLNQLWKHVANDFPIEKQAYYGNTIKMLAMITTSGNAWQP